MAGVRGLSRWRRSRSWLRTLWPKQEPCFPFDLLVGQWEVILRRGTKQELCFLFALLVGQWEVTVRRGGKQEPCFLFDLLVGSNRAPRGQTRAVLSV